MLYKNLVVLVGPRAPPGSKGMGPIPTMDAPIKVVPPPKKTFFKDPSERKLTMDAPIQVIFWDNLQPGSWRGLRANQMDQFLVWRSIYSSISD